MVTLDTLLIIGLIGFGTGVAAAVAAVLLYAIYNNVNVVLDRAQDTPKAKEEEEGQSQFAIPLSALGGYRGISHEDIRRAAAAVAAQQTPTPDKKADLGGQYL